MSGPAYVSQVYLFNNTVALTLMHEDCDGNTEGRTHYLQAAHALQTAVHLIKAAHAVVEGQDFPTTSSLSACCEADLAACMDDVAQLIDREAMRAGKSPRPELLRACVNHLMHYATLQHAHPQAARDAADLRAACMGDEEGADMTSLDDHPEGPMAEHSRDLTRQQLATLKAPPYLTLTEDDAVSGCGMLALDIDTDRPDCPVVLRVHPTLRALLEAMTY